MLPSGRFASDAEYLQQGDDLLLIGPDGATVVVRDYFLTDSPPDLLTPEGGRVTPAIVDSFTPPEAVGQYAQVGNGARRRSGRQQARSGRSSSCGPTAFAKRSGRAIRSIRAMLSRRPMAARSISCSSTRRHSRWAAMRAWR
jgi:hypothetical protein